jgi:hypothetical protein
VVGPFFFTYKSQDGPEAYRRAISDRFFDAIVLDGGVTPQGAAIRQQLGQTVQDFYQRVYSQHDASGFTVEVFKPVRPQGATGADSIELPWPVAYTFDTQTNANDNKDSAWGAHAEASDWQPGLQVESRTEQPWEGHASLRFTPSPSSTSVTLRRSGHVTRLRARIYVASTDPKATPIRVGFVGFDDAWRWHDDGFRWLVPPGSWTTVTWDLASPGDYEEVGLKVPASSVSQLYIGSFEIDP